MTRCLIKVAFLRIVDEYSRDLVLGASRARLRFEKFELDPQKCDSECAASFQKLELLSWEIATFLDVEMQL